MKKILATVSAVVLSLAMVAMPSIAMADDVESTETVTTETVTTETVTTETVTTEPETTEPETTEPETTEPESTEPESTEPESTEPETTEPETTEPETTEPESTEFARSSVAKIESTTEEDDENDKCEADYLKPAELDHSSGSYTLMDGDTVIGTLDWSGDTVEFDLEEGWSIDLCVKSGDQSNPDGSSNKVTYFLGLTGEGEESILQEISHLEYRASFVGSEEECDDLTGARGFSISVDEECPDLKLEVSGTATDQVCEESGDESVGTYVQGEIELTVSDLGGVVKIEYSKNGGSVSEVNLATLLIEDLAPGKYDFVVTVAEGYEAVDDFSVTVKADNDPACKKQEICHWNEGGQGEEGSYNVIDVSIKSIINVPNGHETHEKDIIPPFYYYDGDTEKYFAGLNTNLEVEGCDDFQFPTEGPVIPEVIFTPGTCDADGSYQLISPAESEDVPAGTVTWYVNDVETPEGTYPLVAGEVVTVKVVANFVDYPVDIDGTILTEYTYDPYSFELPTDCVLDTLALTGSSDTTPALALTAFLGLLGLAMVRSGIRVNRIRQEA
jgi:hypothetical protein